MKIKLQLVACLTSLAFTSCASLFDGNTQQVSFTSPQRNSSVTVEGQKYKLPVSTTISKKTTTATFENPSHETKVLAWQRKFQWGYFFMDFLFTPGYGLVGFIWDGTTQAWYKHPQIIDYNFQNGQANVPVEVPQAPKPSSFRGIR
jgi:hypothetical protein